MVPLSTVFFTVVITAVLKGFSKEYELTILLLFPDL
nr:MAG TPA: hypothetical protein [Caudoviricetes sp.]